VTKDQKLARYEAWIKDQAKYCAYPETRREAVKVLNLSIPVPRAVPRKGLAVNA
jgi:hypothetical protein